MTDKLFHENGDVFVVSSEWGLLYRGNYKQGSAPSPKEEAEKAKKKKPTKEEKPPYFVRGGF